MKFQFKVLSPNTHALRVIEAYEAMGYTIGLSTVNEESQWKDSTDYLNFKIEKVGEGELSFDLPKTAFRKKIKYKRWMPREEFELLVKQNPEFAYKDCILSWSSSFLRKYLLGVEQATSSNIGQYAIAYCDEDGEWESKAAEFDSTKFSRVCLITE